MPKNPPPVAHEPAEVNLADRAGLAHPKPADAARKRGEYGQYGMRADDAHAHGSNYGAPTDHESFDDEYRTREMRNHTPRSEPTGLTETPKELAAKPTAGSQ